MVLGVVTAVGGGILRDIIIGELPPAVFQNARNIIIAIAIAFTAFIIAFFVPKDRQNKYTNIYNRVLFISDSVGLGAFTILGIRCVNEQYGYNNPALLLFVGVMTGVGGRHDTRYSCRKCSIHFPQTCICNSVHSGGCRVSVSPENIRFGAFYCIKSLTCVAS